MQKIYQKIDRKKTLYLELNGERRKYLVRNKKTESLGLSNRSRINLNGTN